MNFAFRNWLRVIFVGSTLVGEHALFLHYDNICPSNPLRSARAGSSDFGTSDFLSIDFGWMRYGFITISEKTS
jgi:hypothetical protein